MGGLMVATSGLIASGAILTGAVATIIMIVCAVLTFVALIDILIITARLKKVVTALQIAEEHRNYTDSRLKKIQEAIEVGNKLLQKALTAGEE